MLQKGQVIKNYKELCGLMGWTPTTGNSKKSQLKELGRYYIFHKEGNKFIIDNVYDKPKDKINSRKKIYSNYKLSQSEDKNIGVYIIIDKNNNCYIGSTIRSFRSRFLQHYSIYHNQNMQHTYDLLHKNNAVFKILEDMTGKSEEEIRQRESEYIQQYLNDENYNLINHLDGVSGLGATRRFNIKRYCKPKIKLKVKQDKIEDVLKLLKENDMLGCIEYSECDSVVL